MKILLMYRDLTHGGVQKIMVYVANYFAGCGYDVTLLVGEAKGPYLNLLSSDVKVISINTKNRYSLCKHLITLLRHHKPDILFTGVPSFNLIAIIAKYISLTNTKVIISEHSNTFKEFSKSKNFSYKLSFLLIPFLYRFSDAIIAVSKGVAKDLSKFSFIPCDSIKTIYNPAYSKSIAQVSKFEVNEDWFEYKDCPVIIGVGRLTEQKDFSTLLDAIYTLRKTRNVKLIIVGDGPMYADLQMKIDSYGLNAYVKLVGFKENPISWINKADVFVLSSKWEGFGNILVEALAAGTTIVSTDCKSGPSEILKGGQLGYLVPTCDVKAMSEKIAYAIDNPISKAVLTNAAEEYDEDFIMKEYESLFLSLIHTN